MLELMSEILDIEVGELGEETILEELDEWDSLAKLSLMAEAKKRYHKMIAPDEMKEFKTIGDIILFLQK
ncbi:MAG: acyl carrier protein [Lachnospiraceae bacterium]|nr:acyl carrier protein [Lachnospiraceae bacterium]